MNNNVSKVIKVNENDCTNCKACIKACPVEFCNIAKEDHIEINDDVCIGCGECIRACEQAASLDVNREPARKRVDDFELFINSFPSQKKVVAIVAPAIVSVFPNSYKKLNTWLKKDMGMEAVFDVSFGAELSAKSYIDYILKEEPSHVLTQPCPALCDYAQIWEHSLLEILAPVDSPMVHMMKYIVNKWDDYNNHKIVVVSPCLAKKREYEQTGYGDYNVTMKNLKEYFDENNISLNSYEMSDYDNPEAERAVLFPKPGGLLETVKREVPELENETRVIEGPDKIYEYLENLKHSIKDETAPKLIDGLNCEHGCLIGPGTGNDDKTIDQVDYPVNQRNKELQKKYGTDNSKEEQAPRIIERVKKIFKKERKKKKGKAKLNEVIDKAHKNIDFSRKYRKVNSNIEYPSNQEIQNIFHNMNKYDDDDIKNCTACGYDSCRHMAIAIYNDLNKKDNCLYYLKDRINKEKEKASEYAEAVAKQKEKANEYIQDISEETQELAAVAEELDASNQMVVERSEDSSEKAHESLELLKKLVDKITMLASEIEGLDEIVETINNIANQTNLLALNARIEAANIDGKNTGGFAVIAEEVRKLSANTKKEANNIAPFSEKMEEQLKYVDNEIQHTLEDISDVVKNIEDTVASTEEIGAVVSQVNHSIQELQLNTDQFLESQ